MIQKQREITSFFSSLSAFSLFSLFLRSILMGLFHHRLLVLEAQINHSEESESWVQLGASPGRMPLHMLLTQNEFPLLSDTYECVWECVCAFVCLCVYVVSVTERKIMYPFLCLCPPHVCVCVIVCQCICMCFVCVSVYMDV